MVNYHTVISDAVAGLPIQTYEARQAFYERARAALRTTLYDPDALSETELVKEQSAFEVAIRKVETELVFREMRRDQEEYGALSVPKKIILTAKQFERSLRETIDNKIEIMRDRLSAKGTAHAPKIISNKYQATKSARVRSRMTLPAKADVAAFVQIVHLTAKNVGRQILPIFGKRT
jgi:hypothetical protein